MLDSEATQICKIFFSFYDSLRFSWFISICIYLFWISNSEGKTVTFFVKITQIKTDHQFYIQHFSLLTYLLIKVDLSCKEGRHGVFKVDTARVLEVVNLCQCAIGNHSSPLYHVLYHRLLHLFLVLLLQALLGLTYSSLVIKKNIRETINNHLCEQYSLLDAIEFQQLQGCSPKDLLLAIRC